jgi:hypothetical protein
MAKAGVTVLVFRGLYQRNRMIDQRSPVIGCAGGRFSFLEETP